MNHATFALDSATTTPSSGKKTRWLDLAEDELQTANTAV